MPKHHLIKRSLASGLVIAAASFPAAAQAMFINGGGGGPVTAAATSQSAAPGLGQLQRNVNEWFAVHGRFVPSVDSTAAASTAKPSTAPATSSGGFQWGDAGIGAAGAVVLLGAGGLGVAATRRRRRPLVG